MNRYKGPKSRNKAGGSTADLDKLKGRQSVMQENAEDEVQKAAVSPVQLDIPSSSPVYTTDETFPLRVQGIVLHALWKQQQPSPDVPLETIDGIGIDKNETGLWTILHLVWQPASNRSDTPQLTPVGAEQAITVLFECLKMLYAPDSPGITPSLTPPIYIILHIDKIMVPKPKLYRVYGKKLKEHTDASALTKQEIFVEHLQQLCRMTSKYAVNEWLPSKFHFYDRFEHRQGWLIIAPTHALLVGVGSEQVLTLADQIQPIETDSNRLGILPEQYHYVLARIIQWVSNQDGFLPVDRLRTLVDSSEKSLDGQVSLNLALAAVGILIAFFPGHDFQMAQVIALSCLIAASIAFWGYARWGYHFLTLIGWLCGLLALLSIFWTRLISWLVALWSSLTLLR